MRKKNISFKKGISPGELYASIEVPREDFEKEMGKLVKPQVPRFVQFCKRIHGIAPSLGKGGKFTEEYRAAIDFLNWDLKAEEFSATIKFVMLVSIMLAMFFIMSMILFPELLLAPLMGFAGPLAYLYILFPPIVLVLILVNYVQKYPLNAAKLEQKLALTYVPQIIGYLIMALKLVPNLEKAVEFAAEHGKGKIAEDFRRMLWDVQLGIYNTLSEGLDALAYRWGEYSSEFKESLMMVRASVLEDTEEKRYVLLDKTMANTLESVKGKMEDYARSLAQPSTVLFYIGILLPLILIIILPIGSAFSGSPLASPLILFFIYNIAIPLIAFYFARRIIIERPPTYTPPKIDDDYPGLPGKWKMFIGKRVFDMRILIALILIVGFVGSFFLSWQGVPPKSMFEEGDDIVQFIPYDKTLEEVLEFEGLSANYFEQDGALFRDLRASYPAFDVSDEQIADMVILQKTVFTIENDTTPYIFSFGLVLTFSLCFFIFVYYRAVYKRKIQLKIIGMETEFKDSLYILASRLGENRPVEEAMAHTKRFLPKLAISERIFGKTIDNIKLMGMPLESAVFHPTYGSLVRIPSEIIISGMKVLVDSVRLGVNVAARTLISLSLQLENAEKVNKKLKELVADIAGMMSTMATFIAPVVLGITTALQKIVMVTLASIIGSETISKMSSAEITEASSDLAFEGLPMMSGELLKQDAFSAMASPLIFLLIVAVYVIELVIIMTYFTTKIEEDNDLTFKLRLAKSLPIALIVFLVSVIASNLLVTSFA